MSIANAAAALASEQERVRPELENLALSSSKLWKRFEKNTKVKAVSDRPTRLPTMPSSGGKHSVGNMDGADMGIGSGPTQVPGLLTTVCYISAWSYTKQAEYATDSDEKAIENFATLTRSIAPKKFADFMDINLQGNASNQVDTIVSTVTQGGQIVGVVVNNANFFLDGTDYDIWTAVGGTFVVTVNCESSDILANTVWFQTPLAAGAISAGQGLFVSGASAQSNTGLYGLRYAQVGTNTGNWYSIQRSAWPGKYITPTIPVNGALTPQVVRAIQSLNELSLGDESTEGEIIAHCNVSERDAWEQNALLVQHIDMANLKGDQSVDMLKKKAATQIAGRDMLVNPRALPGYIDFLKLENCERVETKPVDFYDVAGQTLFPIYGQSGGLASGLVFYIVWEGNAVFNQPRQNAFLSGITIPKGLFGH
jgi:hypothetical protein